jgi:hypothetical protein
MEKDTSAMLKKFFKKNKIARLVDLFNLLHTKSRMSVFRRLRELQYLSSYTHSGSYYSIKNILDFNSSGLWYFNEVGFSKFGNLKETLIHIIDDSDSGFTHEELEKKLHVRVHNTLLDLVKSNKISREKADGKYAYFSIQASKSKKQVATRKNYTGKLAGSGLSDFLIIEILASIIRSTKGSLINPEIIVLDLAKSRGVVVVKDQVNWIVEKLDLKKTPGST